MAIARNLSNLPRSSTPDGNPPDSQPRFVRALVAHWMAERDAVGDRPTAADTRLRHSDAAKCARALSFKVAGFPMEPMDAAGVWVTGLGSLVHEAFEHVLPQHFPDAVIETEVPCRIEGLDASGHADALITLPPGAGPGAPERPYRIVYELKTQGGFGFKLGVGERGPAQGPRHSALVQASLNALALDADEVVIGYIATEAMSKSIAERKGFDEFGRFCAEWTYSRKQWEPVARAEVRRLQRILEIIDDGGLAPRVIPDPELPRGAVVVDPASGRWEVHGRRPDVAQDVVLDTGTTWVCGYCPFQSACAGTKGSGIVPRAEVAA